MAMNTKGGRRRAKRRKDRREKGNIKPQDYGGSKEATAAYRKEFKDLGDQGVAKAAAGVDRANKLADASSKQADQSANYYTRAMSNYNAGRDATLNNAAQLENDARTASSTYQNTADKEFALNQARNQNAVLSLGATGGAAGLRQALASSSQANADAAAQAEISRANQFNEMMSQRQNALTQAANIRSGVGAQDQSVASVAGGQQQALNNNVLAASGLGAQVGANQLGVGMGARTGLEEAQLGQATAAEASRANNALANTNRWKQLFMPTL